MKFLLKSSFKSFLVPFDYDLPDLTVLTGLNGAGKTQILSAILDKEKGVLFDEGGSEIPVNRLKYVNSNSLYPPDSNVVYSSSYNSGSTDTYAFYLNQIKNTGVSIAEMRTLDILGYPQTQLLTNIEKVVQNSGKLLDDLAETDFYDHGGLYAGYNRPDIFGHSLGQLFKVYYDKFDDNQYKEFKGLPFISAEKFKSNYGEPPWDLANKIFAEARLNYYVNSPSGSPRYAPFALRLINKIDGANVNFSELSSGEKIIMSLAFALYNSNYEIEIPKVLLMDEPDASLHPSMSKYFLEVVNNIFVKEKGIKVILATHSPSTVAFAPEDSLFIINRIGTRIEKASKDKALGLLSDGVPSFSINYENRRQVFVESPYDVSFYEFIYQKYSRDLNPEISLTFISSGDSKGNKHGIAVASCDQVELITNTLRKAGNNFIYGIIDFDNKNLTKESEFLKVVGHGNRYSIENYLLDPILLSALLLSETILTREDFGMSQDETYFDFKNFETEKIQQIVNVFLEKIALEVNPTNSNKSSCKYLNGTNLEIPNWYLFHQGHSLEDQVLRAFPELQKIKKGREDALKMEILKKIVDNIPSLLSVDLIDLLRELQK